MADYWPLAVTLFTMTIGVFILYSIYTGKKADTAERRHEHFGGVPHRSIYGDIDTTMSARERLDERADARRFRRERTQTVLREERERMGLEDAEPEGGAYADPLRPPAAARSPITSPRENPTSG